MLRWRSGHESFCRFSGGWGRPEINAFNLRYTLGWGELNLVGASILYSTQNDVLADSMRLEAYAWLGWGGALLGCGRTILGRVGPGRINAVLESALLRAGAGPRSTPSTLSTR